MDYTNAHKETFPVITLPKPFVEEDRGVEDCCCEPFLVFGSNSNDSYKRDFTSAWFPNADEIRFYLVKESDGTEIEQTAIQFLNQANAYYCTVNWSQILSDYDSGCYTLKFDYSISGIEETYIWGKYNVVPYSIERKKRMVRFRTIFNDFHEEIGIDFSGSNVVDCINFHGFFGDRQPKTEIKNTTYSNREERKVMRENVNEYTLITDPIRECISKRIIDIHLLHENEIYVSDHNPYNHSYDYLDKPMILSDSPSVEYLSRYAKITAKFEDKVKNKRSLFTK